MLANSAMSISVGHGRGPYCPSGWLANTCVALAVRLRGEFRSMSQIRRPRQRCASAESWFLFPFAFLVLIMIAIPANAAQADARLGELVEHIQLVAQGAKGNYLTVEPADSDDIIEVVRVSRNLLSPLQIMVGTYPLSVEPGEALSRSGVSLPAGWRHARWEAETFAELEGPASDPAAIALFIDQILRHLLSCPSGYQLELELGEL